MSVDFLCCKASISWGTEDLSLLTAGIRTVNECCSFLVSLPRGLLPPYLNILASELMQVFVVLAGADPGMHMIRNILLADPGYAWGALQRGWLVLHDCFLNITDGIPIQLLLYLLLLTFCYVDRDHFIVEMKTLLRLCRTWYLLWLRVALSSRFACEKWAAILRSVLPL